MNFTDLYNFAENSSERPISVESLRREIVADHHWVGDVKLYPVDIDPAVALGLLVFEKDRSSPYDESYTVACIRYYRGLDRDEPMRRFVCCKELMHLFDGEAQQTNTRTRFIRLLSEFEALPLPQDVSEMYKSEINAQWMAVLALCPQRLRLELRPKYPHELDAPAIARLLKIPLGCAIAAMGDYYDTALKRLAP